MAAPLPKPVSSWRAAGGASAGVEVDTQGDAFFVAFASAKDAVAAASDAQRALASGPIHVRMGLHTGTPQLTEEGYVGLAVHEGARIAACSHGGQVVVSKQTKELAGSGFAFTDLGEHRVKDFSEPVWIYQLGSERFPPLKTISNTNLPRPARPLNITQIPRLQAGSARSKTVRTHEDEGCRGRRAGGHQGLVHVHHERGLDVALLAGLVVIDLEHRDGSAALHVHSLALSKDGDGIRERCRARSRRCRRVGRGSASHRQTDSGSTAPWAMRPAGSGSLSRSTSVRR
jgi:hypothetical protein